MHNGKMAATKKVLHRLALPEKDVVSKAKYSAHNDDQEEYANKLIPFYNRESCAKGTADCITNSHWYGNRKYNAAATGKK